MMKQFILLLSSLLLLGMAAIQAQNPTSITMPDGWHPNNSPFRNCPGTSWFAGTSEQALGTTAQSNDVEYLCVGDTLIVTHNLDYNLDPASDPNPLTPAGITYAYYDCPPTATGPDIDDLNNDPCHTPDPNGVGMIDLLFVATDGMVPDGVDINGNVNFFNDGTAQQNFFGPGDPVAFYFAPYTNADHATLNYEFDPTNPDDICVHLNAADAFRVVYLNTIEATNINNNAGDPCTGSFTISGGLPQFDALNGSSSNYTISILDVLSNIVGTITSGPATHNSTVTFTVPGPQVFSIIVEDGKSCMHTFNMDMTACAATTTSISLNPTDISCNGADDGSIEVNITGGTAPYSIAWQLLPGGPISSDNSNASPYTITNLQPGNYGVTVTDNNAEQAIQGTSISEPQALGASLVSLIQPTCNGDSTGSVSVEVTLGGVVVIPDTSYTFQWDNTTQTTSTITNVPSGPYSVTVTNGNGCTATSSATLSQPAAITAPPMATGAGINHASCEGIADGSATITANGGTGTLSYTWSTSPIQSTATASNLEDGTYTVTVSDANGCSITGEATLVNTTVLSATVIPTDISCNSANDGAVTAQHTVVGVNNGGYNYTWFPNINNSQSLNNLPPGSYAVTITDGNGCSAIADTILTEPDSLLVTTSVTHESCNVGNDGTATATATGGTTPYNFLWDDFTNSPNLNNLSSGSYTISVTDANGCATATNAVINPPNPPVITSIDSISISCPNANDGALTVMTTLGNDSIVGYLWSNNDTTAQTTGLGPGTYTVTVTDAGGCEVTATASLFVPAPMIELQPAQTTRPNCPGSGEGTITVFVGGGSPPYNYAWDSGSSGPAFSTVTNLTAGFHTVTVTDSNNCEFIISDIEVEDPPAITVLFEDIQPVSCDQANGGICNGQATVTASGGMASIYTFEWSSGETFTGNPSTAFQLCQGIQSVTVSDGFCPTVFELAGPDSIPSPPLVTGTVNTTDAACLGDENGSATVSPTGGDGGPYDIVWSNGQVGPTAIDLIPDSTYTLTIVDGNGCQGTLQTSVGEPQLLELLVVDNINISCNGEQDGQIQVAPIGGNPGSFTYEWSHDVSLNTNAAGGLPEGGYAVTVTDERGCTASITASIIEPSLITLFLEEVPSPECNGFAAVFALDSVQGGYGQPYTYTIDGFNFQSTNQAVPVLAGSYLLEVSDSLGCTVTDSITITEPDPILVDLTLNFDSDTIEIELGESYPIVPQVTPVGTVDSFYWNTIFGFDCVDCFTPIATPIDDITYTLTVQNAAGCLGTGSVFIDIDPNRNVYIPNAFTPNDDGVNDYFTPYIGNGVSNINSIRIFDRWGELVWTATDFVPSDLGGGWDGRLNGKRMNPAAFIYVIEVAFTDGEIRTYKGDVTLIR